MKWKIKQLLLKILIILLAVYITALAITKFTPQQTVEPIRVINQEQQLTSSEYIISKELILGKLQQHSQIVSLEQLLEDSFVHVDDGLFGKRTTELNVEGTYLMGLETKDIIVKHIDTSTGIVYISLPDPILINLDLPYDKLSFEKQSGWLRLAMNEEEQKTFYKSIKKSIESDLMKNEEVLEQAKLYNQKAVEDILKLLPIVKSVVFE